MRAAMGKPEPKEKRPKFSHECDLGELADRMEKIIEEERMDTAPRDSLLYIADRIRALGEKHTPDILRDLRDLGWVVVNHCDLLDEGPNIPTRARWIMHKRDQNSGYRYKGLTFEATGESDEEALWMIAAMVARHELRTQAKLRYANRLIKKDGKSFAQAMRAAKRYKPGKRRQ